MSREGPGLFGVSADGWCCVEAQLVVRLQASGLITSSWSQFCVGQVFGANGPRYQLAALLVLLNVPQYDCCPCPCSPALTRKRGKAAAPASPKTLQDQQVGLAQVPVK